ncbi:MAG: hypothetical protein U0074_08405 [Kouleothrix sp.]
MPRHQGVCKYLKRARLKEDSGTPPDAMTMIANLRDDHEAAIRQLRADADACDSQFNDSGTKRLPDWPDAAAREDSLDAAFAFGVAADTTNSTTTPVPTHRRCCVHGSWG